MNLRDAIRGKALALGFDAVGFARTELAPEARDNLQAFIARGLHGGRHRHWPALFSGRK